MFMFIETSLLNEEKYLKLKTSIFGLELTMTGGKKAIPGSISLWKLA